MPNTIEQEAGSAGIAVNFACLSLRNYIYWSTLIGLFSSVLVIRIPFAIRFFDGIMLVNLTLMLLLVDFLRIRAWIAFFILYLAASGAIGIVNGTDTLAQVTKELLGISVSVLYFYYFFKLIDNDFARAFIGYTEIAYWFAIVALPMWAATCFYFHSFERLRGLALEAGAFSEIVLPALYWYAYQYVAFRKGGLRVLVIGVAVILSGSSNAFICLGFGMLLLFSGRTKYFVAVSAVVAGLLAFTYAVSHDFQRRVDHTFLAASTQDVSGSNLSTYALMSNLFVTQQVLKESPLIGNGLGSHSLSHARFIGDVPGSDLFASMGMESLNAPDGASMTLRSLSELGLIGFLGILVFIYHFRVRGTGSQAAIGHAIQVGFLFKLIRDGNYFVPEQFFFVIIYMLNHSHTSHGLRSSRRRRFVWVNKAVGSLLKNPVQLS